MFQNVPSYSQPILQQILQIAKAILQHESPAKSPLTAILKHFIQKYKKGETGIVAKATGKTLSRRGSHDSREIVQSVTSTLIAESLSASTNIGLLIDKLASMEPELIGSSPQLQVSICYCVLLFMNIHRIGQNIIVVLF